MFAHLFRNTVDKNYLLTNYVAVCEAIEKVVDSSGQMFF